MKRPDAGRGADCLVRIPRRNRRGLIEAMTCASIVAAIEDEFPGEIAGASLKLVVTTVALSRLPANSPAKSPGPH